MHRNLLYEYSELVAAKLNSCFSQGSLFPDASGRHQAWLIVTVYRWLRPLLTAVCDSTWNGHTVDHMNVRKCTANGGTVNAQAEHNASVCQIGAYAYSIQRIPLDGTSLMLGRYHLVAPVERAATPCARAPGTAGPCKQAPQA